MAQKILIFEPKKCIGCRLCEEWCSITHFGIISPARSRIRITRHHLTQTDSGTFCRQCPDAPCIAACQKFQALSRDPDTGSVIVNREKCVGCRLCIKACPYSAPVMDPSERKILICNLCKGDPQCVKHCPENAIRYAEPNNTNRPDHPLAIESSAEEVKTCE